MKIEESVKFIRLCTGEDLIAVVMDVDNGEEQYYVISNPMKLLYTTSTNPGYLAVSLMQWVFHRVCEEQNFTIYSQDVLTIGTPTDKMTSYYWDCVEHFASKHQDGVRFGDDENEGFDDITEDEKAMELLKEVLDKVKTDRGKLH